MRDDTEPRKPLGKGLGDFADEARGKCGFGDATTIFAAHAGPGEIQLLAGARHSHVTKTALFFHLVVVLQCAGVGEKPFFEPGEEDNRELETFGVVNREQRDLRFLIHGIGIAHQSGVVEKVANRFAAIGGLGGGVDQLAQVGDAAVVFGRRVGFESLDIAGAVEQFAQQNYNTFVFEVFAQLEDHLAENIERGFGAGTERVGFDLLADGFPRTDFIGLRV